MDRPELPGTSGGKASARHLIRRATLEDVPWMVEGAKSLFHGLNDEDSVNFLTLAIQSPHAIILRGEHSAIGAGVYEWPYNKKIWMAEDMFIASDGEDVWELVAIFTELCKELRNMGVLEFKFDLSNFSKTGKSLEPFAKRIGASIERPLYRINLQSVH